MYSWVELYWAGSSWLKRTSDRDAVYEPAKRSGWDDVVVEDEEDEEASGQDNAPMSVVLGSRVFSKKRLRRKTETKMMAIPIQGVGSSPRRLNTRPAEIASDCPTSAHVDILSSVYAARRGAANDSLTRRPSR